MWKVEKVETITLETKCQVEEKGGMRDNYSLKMTLELDENKSKELLQSQNVSVGAEVEFKALGDWRAIQNFRDSDGDIEMKVTTGEHEPNLKLELTKGKPLYGGGYGWERVDENFVCKESRVKPICGGYWQIGKHVFTGEMLSLDRKQLIDFGTRSISFSVALGSCESEDGGTVATCDLKLTTGSDLKD